MSLPSSVPTAAVSILLPVLDEVDAIDECLASLAAQDYPGRVEILAADGGSQDGTLDRLAEWERRLERLRVLHNPGRRQSLGLNLAAAAAAGEILVRADAHSRYAPDYVRACVDALLSTDAVAVGGHLVPQGRTRMGAAIALAMTLPFATGTGAFHDPRRAGPVDTVYLGALRRADFLAHGGFRSLPSGAAEDADFYWRWRRRGRTVLLDPAIRSVYRPRETLRALAAQHWRYGRGKAEMLRLNRRLPSARPLAPAALVGALAAAAAAGGAAGRWTPLGSLTAAYLTVVGLTAARAGGRARDTAAVRAPGTAVRVTAATGTMHLAYGAGFLSRLMIPPGE